MIKTLIENLFQRGFNSLMIRAMPIILESYYTEYAVQWHPHYALRQEALAETVTYIKANMPGAMIKTNEYEVLNYAGRHITLDGLFLEFGVRTGNTINFIATQCPTQTLYGFDSFKGLPEEWSGWIQDKGIFAMDSLPKVGANVELVVGWFDETLPTFLAEHPQDVAFVHIDSDLYTSAKTILTALAPRIKPGTIIVFNEYFNYPNWQQHEFKAFQEFCADFGVRYDYLCWGQFEVALKIREISAPGAA